MVAKAVRRANRTLVPLWSEYDQGPIRLRGRINQIDRVWSLCEAHAAKDT